LAFQSAHASEWKHIYTKDDIEVSKKDIEDTAFFAFRGEGEVDVHIGRLAGVLLDTRLGPDWVDLQTECKMVRTHNENHTVIYNRYDLTWPVSDRDYVLDRQVSLDDQSKVMTVQYKSVEDALQPERDCCVRAEAVRTYWRFTAIPGKNRTKVEVEVLTDPRGSLPAWLVNMIQRGWPYNSILGLANRAKKEDVTADIRFADW